MSVAAHDLPARQHVGQRLRILRETAGMALGVAAGHLRVPIDMLHEVETGRYGVPPPLARAMTRLYDAPDPDVLAMARLVRHRGQAADVAAWHRDQLAWESCATRICEVATVHVPELLRTPAYAQAVFPSQVGRAVAHRTTEDGIGSGLAVLAARQRRLAGPPWLPTHVVITEQALRTPIAPPTGMAAQWTHLLTATARQAVTVRVLPTASVGLTVSQHGWRTLDFAGTPEPRWLFRRYGWVTAPTDNTEMVATAYRKFLRLQAASLPVDQSQTFIHQLINQTSGAVHWGDHG